MKSFACLAFVLWLALCPAAVPVFAAMDAPVQNSTAPSMGAAIGWTIAKRVGASLAGGAAGFGVGLGARWLVLRALASVALPALVPAAAGVLTVVTLTVAGVMAANWIYNAVKDARVKAALKRAESPAQAAGADATDDAGQGVPPVAAGPRAVPGMGPGGLLGVRPEPFDDKRLADEFPR